MPTITSRWRPIRIINEVIVAAVSAACATAIVGLPQSTVRGTLFVAAVLFPTALLCAALVALLQPLLLRRIERSPRATAKILVAIQLAAGTCAAAIYVSNLLLVDGPWGPCTRVGYAIGALTAAVIVWLGRGAAVKIERQIARVGLGLVLGAWLVVDGIVVALLDSYGIRPEYHVHNFLALLGLAGTAAGAFLLLRTRLSWRMNLATALVVTIACAALAPDRATLYRALAAAPGAHGRVLRMARAWGDRDGDRFSAWFGGGDCDDDDATAYPLSPQHDCLGWRRQRLPPVPPLAAVSARASAPRLILLLTIDAFRCGFGIREAEPLRSACPNLTRIAGEGWSRLDAHTSVPSTYSSLTVMMTGNPNADPLDYHRSRPTLPQRLEDAGYATEVLITFPLVIQDQAVRDSFQRVNYDLLSTPTSPFRGDVLSDHIVERARQLLDDPKQRTFLWAHYPDPHFPFMVDDSPFKHTTIDDYAEIVRRTDSAIGHLLTELSAQPNASDVLVLITADHGEEFGEHGQRYHGFTLYEAGVRVPIIAWSPRDHRRFASAPPPPSSAEIGDYLLAAVDPSSVKPRLSADVLLRTVMVDQQYGVISGEQKLIYNATRNTTQLFDLDRDPGETNDLAAKEPERVAELGRRLGRLLSPVSQRESARARATRPR